MGTERPDSDIDVLQIAWGRGGSYSNGQINVSAYLPKTLKNMAERGSLFILHLKLSALVISDPTNILNDTLRAYRPPASYQPLFAELKAAASALWPAEDTHRYWAKLRQLGLYVLRTAVYAKAAEAGAPQFDTNLAAVAVGIPEVQTALGIRFDTPDTFNDLTTLRQAIQILLGPIPRNESNSIEALAVSLSDGHSYAASLLAQTLIASSAGLEYTALTPPPL
jgi:hypothetical protein